MARITVDELVAEIGQAYARSAATAGEQVYDIHVFLQTYPTQAGPDYYTVHCDQSYIAYDRREEYAPAEDALRSELPNAVFDISYDDDAYESAAEAVEAALESAVW